MNYTKFTVSLIFALFATLSHAQELDLTALDSGVQHGFNRRSQQARVDTIPTSYFADEDVSQSVDADQASTAQQNLLILGCFATLLGAGGVITAISVMRRRKVARRVNVAPPLKLCA